MKSRSSYASEIQGKYYKLTADLDLTTESDPSYYSFRGHLDGQNHKITIAITIGSSCTLFGEVSSDAVAIRNLNVEGSVSGGNVVGGIASHLTAGIIESCSFTGTIEASHRAGGIAGEVGQHVSGYETLSTYTPDIPEGIVQPVILSSDVVENIAQTLSIDSSQIQFISQENISPAEKPSQSMTEYVQADSHTITGKLGVISVDTAGVYVVKVVMTDELFAVLKDQNVSDFKIYALSDKDPVEVSNSLISGMIGLSLSREKLTNFDVREFLMVGMLNAGTPFSMYIAKILIALILGGCNSSVITSWLGVLALIVISALRFRKR